MQLEESVSQWIDQLATGDAAAAQQLWQRYFRRLVALARKKLQDLPRRAVDEEDVALSAFASFCRCAQLDRFPQLLDRDDLWQVLVVLTARKAHHQASRAKAQKRGGGRLADTPLPGAEADAAPDQILSREPTPEFAAQVAEGYQRLLDSLEDDPLRQVTVWKLEGYTNEEIAARLGLTVRSVGRKLRIIRQKLRMLDKAAQQEDE